MPAITKDAALRNLGHIAEELGKAQSSAVMVNRLIEVVDYITDTAATQAAEKPQDGLVNPPSRAEPASQHYVDSATVIDVRYEFERWMSGRGEAAEYICDGLYSDGAVQDQAEAFAAGVALSGGFREGRNAQPDSATDLAPTDLSAVEVPPLDSRQQFEIYASNMGLRDFEISSDDADNYRNPGMQGPWNFWRAGRASMKGNK